MKKILVVLLVLAVAGGVFAQEGEWSLSGAVSVGTHIDLDIDIDTNDDPVVGYSDGTDRTNSTFGISYERGGIGIGIDFGQFNDFSGTLTYDGENFKFKAGANLSKLFFAVAGGSVDDNSAYFGDSLTNSLWGSYEMLNGMVHLETAFKSRDISGKYWTSNTVGAFYDNGANNGTFLGYRDTLSLNKTFDGAGNSFSAFDGGNFLLANLSLNNLSFGVLVPNLFFSEQYGVGNRNGYAKSPVASYRSYDDTESALLAADIMRKMVVGVKVDMQPMEFAAQILLEDYAVYFGGSIGFGNLTAGASFMGILAPTDGDGEPTHETIMKVGGSVGYDTDAFGAGLEAWLGMLGDPSNENGTQVGFEPYFSYNVIPTHLQFKVNASFIFNNVYNGSEKDTENSEVIWGLKPQLYWNFLGTGAGTWDTGIGVKYTMIKDRQNTLDVMFKFSF